jgi:LuxR family transcriptional regulator, maltose regulon positive regulatory protein
MGDSDVRQRAGRTYRVPPAFDVVAAKLRRPVTRPGTIRRTALVDRLMRDDCGPIVSLAAPAGYGKTTLLAQWAERDGRAFAWVSLDENDNDPKVLLTYVTRALDAVQPVGAQVFEALTSPVSSVPGSVVPRLGSAFASMTVPVVLVLDDVHVLANRVGQAALSVLADHVPKGSRMVLASRTEPPLRMARLRAEGRVTEVGPADLSLTAEQAGPLLRYAGVVLGTDEVAALQRRTEGWAAGLYLAALAIRAGGSLPGAAGSFGGDDRFVSEYLESEFLARISSRDREFLTRTAVLERMSGPLCEAVLERPGAAADLAGLARSNLLLVPLDRRGAWYRYHHLFRDMLLAELERTEPGLLPLLRRRAASWYLRHDRPEEALEYSMAAGDVEEAARLTEQLTLPTYRQARTATLQRWFGWLEDRRAIERHPLVALWAAVLAASVGRPAEAERWADLVDRWLAEDAAGTPDPDVRAWAAVVRALLCRHGVERMRTDADEAVLRCAEAGIVAPVAPLMQGIARVLCGDLDGGEESISDAIAIGEIGAPDVLAVAWCERALLAMARGEWSQVEDLARRARAVLDSAGIEHPLACAVHARVAVHRGDISAARHELTGAQRLGPMLTYAQPHLAVQTRIELIRVYLALADIAGARTQMREVDEVLERRPGLGTLVDEARALRDRLPAARAPASVKASALTSAELRVVPLLATHLSFPEIGAELFLSPHTVKSQAMSLYRKLEASSRSQAVARCRELGLLEA